MVSVLGFVVAVLGFVVAVLGFVVFALGVGAGACCGLMQASPTSAGLSPEACNDIVREG